MSLFHRAPKTCNINLSELMMPVVIRMIRMIRIIPQELYDDIDSDMQLNPELNAPLILTTEYLTLFY